MRQYQSTYILIKQQPQKIPEIYSPFDCQLKLVIETLKKYKMKNKKELHFKW